MLQHYMVAQITEAAKVADLAASKSDRWLFLFALILLLGAGAIMVRLLWRDRQDLVRSLTGLATDQQKVMADYNVLMGGVKEQLGASTVGLNKCEAQLGENTRALKDILDRR